MTCKTTRMSIDVPLEEHRLIKMLALAQGLTIKALLASCIHEMIYTENKLNKTTLKALKEAHEGKTKKAKNFTDLCKQIGL